MTGLLRKSVKYYSENFSAVLGFGILLIFVLFFIGLSGVFVSSSSMFFGYSLANVPFFDLVLFSTGMAVFLFLYSLFVISLVFSVRNYFNQVKMHFYLSEKIMMFALKYFVFLGLSALLFFIVAGFFYSVGTPWLGFLLAFVFFVLFLFLPQSIVVDEESLLASMQSSADFSAKNPTELFTVFGAGLVFFTILLLLEFVLNFFFMPGEFLSLFLTVVFVVPFLEVLKTAYYMQKFGLVKRTSLAL